MLNVSKMRFVNFLLAILPLGMGINPLVGVMLYSFFGDTEFIPFIKYCGVIFVTYLISEGWHWQREEQQDADYILLLPMATAGVSIFFMGMAYLKLAWWCLLFGYIISPLMWLFIGIMLLCQPKGKRSIANIFKFKKDTTDVVKSEL